MVMPTRYSTFLMRSYKNNKKPYPDVDLSRQKIYEAQSQKQDFFVGTDIYFVVTN